MSPTTCPFCGKAASIFARNCARCGRALDPPESEDLEAGRDFDGDGELYETINSIICGMAVLALAFSVAAVVLARL